MCKIKANQKKAVALALQMDGEVWAAYEYREGRKGPRDLTTVVVIFKRFVKSYRVTGAGDLKFEKRKFYPSVTDLGELKAMFGLPYGNLCRLENLRAV